MNYEAFVSLLGRSSAQASLLVILVVLVQRIFKRWLSPQIRCALWLLPALRLILPVSFSSGASVFNLFPKLDSNPATIVHRATTPVSTQPDNLSLGNETLSVNGIRPPQIQSSAKQTPLIDPLIREQSAVTSIPLNTSAPPSFPVKTPTITAKPSIHLGWGILAFGLWAVVAGILLLRVWMTSRQMVRNFRKLKPLADQKTLDLFEGCKEEVRVGTMIDLVESAEITSPVLFGCLRPRLILPAGLRENLSWEELRFIFLHELAHVRRQDILFNWAGALLQIAHWFNPLIWFAFARWRADREVACDALALETAGEEKKEDYGRTILRLLAAAPGKIAAPAMVGILEDKRQLKERITMIGGYVPRKGWPFLAILFLAVLAWVGLTDARRGVVAAQKTAAIEKSPTDEGTRPTNMTTINEIAPDLFRLSIYVPDFDMQFNHFLVRDEEPLLFHAGFKGMFPALREAVGTLIDPAKLRHIAWSHFESDEVGALNHWLGVAPQAQPVCTLVGKLVTVDDFAIRPARGMTADDVLTTGKYRYRFCRSPHMPHGWDAGVLFEETRKTLFCSDLFHHFGNVAPVTSSDLIDPARKAMQQMQQGPLADYMPYTSQTEGVLRGLAALKPETLAVMHGSSYIGKSDKLLTDLAGVIKESFNNGQ